MTELIAVPKPNEWSRLKALVLDSVSSPITRRVYNLGLDEAFRNPVTNQSHEKTAAIN